MWETSYHAIADLLKGGQGQVLLVSRSDQRGRQLAALARQAGVRCQQVSPQQVQQRCQQKANFALLCHRPSGPLHLSELEVTPHSLFLLLDGITDVGNLGAILRSCHRFAVDAIIIPLRRGGSMESQAIARCSAGASHACTLVQSNLAQAVKHLHEQGVWVYATTADGQDLRRWQPNWPCALILGAEDRGVSPLLRQQADQELTIRYPGSRDSLNVSVAAGIFLYQARWAS